jgi:hypothetical protein
MNPPGTTQAVISLRRFAGEAPWAEMSAFAQSRSRGLVYLCDSAHKEKHMIEEKQNPKQESEHQPQQANNQPSGQQQDREPVQTPQQQDSQKDRKIQKERKNSPISLRTL